MKSNEIIVEVMHLRGFTQRSLADKLGRSTSTVVSNAIARKNGMRIDKLLEMLDAMDCEIVVRSKLKDKSEWTISG